MATAKKAATRKAAATSAAAKNVVAKGVTATKTDRARAAKPKQKLIRDSFTMPKDEYAAIDLLKQRAARLNRLVKKSELLRAGIGALNAMSDVAFLAAVKVIPNLKTGRPKHSKAAAVPAPGTRR